MICILPYTVEYMKQYHPYPANDGIHKYYIITKLGRKNLFGAVGYSDFTKQKKNRGLMYSTIKVRERHPRPHHECATVFARR
jgi:hypothetical protein